MGRRSRAVFLERLEWRQLLHAADLLGAADLAAAADVAEGETEQVPDFHLTDVNPNSASHNRDISPRDYMGQISAWYFGHAT